MPKTTCIASAARAGRGGTAVTLVSGGGIYKLRAIERFTKTPIRRERLPTAEAVAVRRADALAVSLQSTLAAGPFPAEAWLVDRLLAEGHSARDVAAAILYRFAPAPADGTAREEREQSAAQPREKQHRHPRHPPNGGHHGQREGHAAHRRKIGPWARKNTCRK